MTVPVRHQALRAPDVAHSHARGVGRGLEPGVARGVVPGLALPAALATALVILAPPRRLGPALAAGLHAHDGGAALLLAAVGAAAWAVLAWLSVGIAVTLLGAAPGAVGATARRLSHRITPALIRSLLAGGTAVGVALTPALIPVAAQAAGCAPATAPGLPSLDRPVSGCLEPSGPPASSTPRTSTGRAAPTKAPAPTAPTAPTRPSSAAPPRTTGLLTVRAGDTLWTLASEDLRAAGRPADDGAVAARWPAWWQANRAEIGADPGLLHPGEVLRPPAPALGRQEMS